MLEQLIQGRILGRQLHLAHTHALLASRQALGVQDIHQAVLNRFHRGSRCGRPLVHGQDLAVLIVQIPDVCQSHARCLSQHLRLSNDRPLGSRRLQLLDPGLNLGLRKQLGRGTPNRFVLPVLRLREGPAEGLGLIAAVLKVLNDSPFFSSCQFVRVLCFRHTYRAC